MNWNFFRPNKKKSILLLFLVLASLFVFYYSFVFTSGSFGFFKVVIVWVFLFPVLLTLQKTSNSGNISYWILVIPLQFLYLYLLSCILSAIPSYRKIIAYIRARWTSILIATVVLPIIVWFAIVPFLSFKFTLGLQLFTAIPVVIVSFIGYKIIEYLFKLPRLKIWLLIVLFILGYAIASGIFYALPTCGYSRSGLGGSESQECECKGVKITLDTSFALDAYSTKTVCIGSGHRGDKTSILLNRSITQPQL